MVTKWVRVARLHTCLHHSICACTTLCGRAPLYMCVHHSMCACTTLCVRAPLYVCVHHSMCACHLPGATHWGINCNKLQHTGGLGGRNEGVDTLQHTATHRHTLQQTRGLGGGNKEVCICNSVRLAPRNRKIQSYLFWEQMGWLSGWFRV